MKNSPELPKQPNILIVMTDHQRADTVRSEHPAPTTNMERLARYPLRERVLPIAALLPVPCGLPHRSLPLAKRRLEQCE
jgi:hypothetical protein